ncbi:hypothetical protein COV24_03985 [candidate division WWE3 bacterium CG10_big_fil_rev_8_21_14_0_10_32_10]|uniref:Lipid II flippase MurJ n=1 Tax=candidate division WWE3 bacterium CG10_big_fil_rev_8_21_14_0_10_32_10 TaxID=1975090 RepID=A0A2H0RA11_UNCKA|nr:MAG: hypothetical protein COV24_03985 [candidate division WWE3 bacterium CG10_big_fil_rev_8_21_14_0_10_32_10]
MTLKYFNKLANILNSEDSLSSAAIIVSITYFISAFIGLFRNRILATYFGDSVELGVFYMADKLPSFLYSLLVVTAVSSAFIPVFSEYKKKSKKMANLFISNILNFSLILYIFFSIFIFIFSDFFSKLISWNSLDENSLSLMSQIMRYILFSQLVLLVSTYYSIYLQSYKRFILPALVPVFYNTGIILGTLFFYNKFGILAPSLGMVLGALFGVVIQLPLMFILGYRHYLYLSLDTGIKKVFKIVVPKILGVSVHRLYILLVNGLISLIYQSPSYIVIYEFANQLQTMPVNAFGSSLSQAMLPTLSDYAFEKKMVRIRSILKEYVLKISYFTLPLAIMFFVLRIPLVRLLFGGDRFSWLGTNLTAYTLAFFSISIWAQTLSVIFSRVFYSFKDSKTPTNIGIGTLFISFILSVVFSFYYKMGVWSFALAFSLGSLLNALLLYIYLVKIVGNFIKSSLFELIKMAYATLFSGLITYLLMIYLDKVVFDTTRTIPLFILTTIIIFIGSLTYVLFTELLGIKYLRDLFFKYTKHSNLVK